MQFGARYSKLCSPRADLIYWFAPYAKLFVLFTQILKSFLGLKVWHIAQKMGAWRKTVYEIDPCTKVVDVLANSNVLLPNFFQFFFSAPFLRLSKKCVRMCVCVCVWEREREREKGRESYLFFSILQIYRRKKMRALPLPFNIFIFLF